MPPSKHSSIGASSCERWWNCPGSVRLSEGIESKSSPVAEEGTAAHELAELCLKENRHPEYYLYKKASNGVTFDEDMVKYVNLYVSKIFTDYAKLSEQSLFCKLHVEEKFALEAEEDAFGTNDACIETFETLDIYDLKYGQGIMVSAVGNKQGLFYALGMWQKRRNIKVIRIHIIQPRSTSEDGIFKVWEITDKELAQFEKDLIKRIKATRAKNAKCIPGLWCRFCRGAIKCKAVVKQAQELAQKEFSPVEMLEPQELTASQIKNVLQFADVFSTWIKRVQEHALDLAIEGQTIEEYKLVEKRAIRKWTDEDEVIKSLANMGEAIFEKKLLSPAKMEKAFGKKALKGSLAEYISCKSSGYKLVAIGEPRPEVVFKTAAEEFERIT